MILSGCQGLVGNNKLAIFEPDTLDTLNYSDHYDLWGVIADHQ